MVAVDIGERANGLRDEMDRCLAFGLGEWESDPLGPEDLPHAGEVARLAGCELAERDGEMVYRRSWGRDESDAPSAARTRGGGRAISPTP